MNRTESIQTGQVVRFTPIGFRTRVTIHVSRVDEHGFVLGHRAKVEGGCIITRGELRAFTPSLSSDIEVIR